MAVMMAIIAPMTQFVFVCQGGQPIQQIYSNYPISIVRSTDTTDTTYSLVVAIHITGTLLALMTGIDILVRFWA